mgnify:CR=1 FL=1
MNTRISVVVILGFELMVGYSICWYVGIRLETCDDTEELQGCVELMLFGLFIKYMISWVDFLPSIALHKRLLTTQSKYLDMEGKM